MGSPLPNDRGRGAQGADACARPVWFSGERMKLLDLHALAPKLCTLLPDRIDVHLNGGGLLVAIGIGLYTPGAGVVAFGALLFYLGVRPA
jgi:hypothetical protein